MAWFGCLLILYCFYHVHVILFVCLFGFNIAFNIICHITTVSGCDRELNAHFYSAASLWYLPDTTSSHIILTPEGPVLALPQKSECQAGSN